MGPLDVTSPDAVLRAIREYDELGRRAFRAKYGFKKPTRRMLVHDGREYDPNAVLAAAHGFQYPHKGPLPANCSGWDQTTRTLAALGFRMTEMASLFGPVRPPVASARLDWTREEVILAMDFYVGCGALSGQPIPGQESGEIAQLSKLLKTLGAYPPEIQGEKCRNPQGVYLKLMNLRAIQTEGVHGINAYSQIDAAVWRDYIDNLPGLHAEAADIRQGVEDGVLSPASAMAPAVEDVSIEQQHTERFMVSPSGEPRQAQRAEQRLVLRYRDYMAAKGVTIGRKKYLPTGQVRPIYCDVWVEARQALIEAKNSDGRDALRQAIGQLYDYRRFHEPPPQLAVLLPYRPNLDGLDLLHSAGIEAVWPHGSGFRDSASGAFV
jgi:hypothetical protein